MNTSPGRRADRADPIERSTNRHDASLQRFAHRRTSARQALDETFNRSMRGGADNAASTRGRIYSEPAAVVDQSALDRSRATFDVRQSMRQEEMRNTQLRMSAAEAHIGAARIPDHMGSATGAVKEIVELERILEKRIQGVEKTSRAIASASDTIDSEAMLARARAEAETWTRGTATTARQASNMDANEVQAVIAERNELRVQVRQASAELHKIKVAMGGDPANLMRYCQADMARVAQLRSSVELEIEGLKIHILSSKEECEENGRQLKGAESRIQTSEEQLDERAETIVQLSTQVEQLEALVEQTQAEGASALEAALKDKHDRMTDVHAQERDHTIREHRDRHMDETREALEALKADLEADHGRVLTEHLSEQQHIMQSQHQHQLAGEVDAITRELNDRESRNVETLRAQMQAEYERSAAVLNQRIRTIEGRAASDMTEAKERAEQMLEKSLEEQKKMILADALYEKNTALEKLETTLGNKHTGIIQDMRSNTTRKHRDDLTHGKKVVEDQLRKKLNHDHSQDKTKALKAQAEKLAIESRAELEKARAAMSRRHAGELRREVDKEVEAATKQVTRDHARDRAQAAERAAADFKVEKTKALDALRARIEKHHRADTDDLKSTIRKLTDEVNALRQTSRVGAEKMQTALRKEKTVALDGLRERLLKKSEQDGSELRADYTKLSEDYDSLKKEKAAAIERLKSEFRKEKTLATETIRSRQKAQSDTDGEELKRQVAQLSDDLAKAKQDKIRAVERMTADYRVDKTKELEGLRNRMKEQQAKDTAELRAEIARLAEQNHRLDMQTHQESNETQQSHNTGKQALHGLRDMLRKLLNSMKIALVPRVNAPLDTSVASPSQAMGALQVLIKGLSLKVPDVSALSDPTREAKAAPMVSFDILYVCAAELSEYLNNANEELVNLHEALTRDRKLVRKNCEDELQSEFENRLLETKVLMERQVEVAVATRAASMQTLHAKQMEKQQGHLEEELKVYKTRLAGKKQRFESNLTSNLREHQEALATMHAAVGSADDDARLQEEEHLAMVEAMVEEADTFKAALMQRDEQVHVLEAEKQGLLDDNNDLRDALEQQLSQFTGAAMPSQSDSSFGTSPAITPQQSIAMQGYDPRVFELERIRLEKRISNLQAALDHVLGEGDDDDDDGGDDYGY